MKEELLHYVWKTKAIEPAIDLKTTDQEALQILHFGYANDSDGPDFLEAEIIIDKLRWKGSVEMHINASDWMRHGHQGDELYENTVLHVVWNADMDIFRADGTKIPCFEIKPYIPRKLIDRHDQIQLSKDEISCSNLSQGINPLFWRQQLDKALKERHHRKIQILEQRLEELKGDWEQLFFETLCKYSVSGSNRSPMQQLVENVPVRNLLRRARSLLEVESYLLGSAHLIPQRPTEAYTKQLKEQHKYLQELLGLRGKMTYPWKYSHSRPSNYPQYRIAQIASIIHQEKYGFQNFIAMKTSDELTDYLDQVKMSEFWSTHYNFNKRHDKKNKRISQGLKDNWIINVIVPMKKLYAKINNLPDLEIESEAMLMTVSPESNKYTRQWEKNGHQPENAWESQAFLEQKTVYCMHKRCLQCVIGHQVLKRE